MITPLPVTPPAQPENRRVAQPKPPPPLQGVGTLSTRPATLLLVKLMVYTYSVNGEEFQLLKKKQTMNLIINTKP